MQADRELLEKAAKAAGYDGHIAIYGWTAAGGVALDRNDPQEEWNPLTDDGDALRLAVKLCITDLAECVGRTVFEEGEQSDIYATTRRAIVRAAAALCDAKGGGE